MDDVIVKNRLARENKFVSRPAFPPETDFKMEDDIPRELFEPLDPSEKSTEEISRPSVSYWKNVWQRLRKDPLAVSGIVAIIIITLVAIFGPMLVPYTYDGQDIINQNQWPSAQHWFGTDKFGRDIFVRILYGARISLTIGYVTAALNMVIGVLYGGISAYFGGKVDMVMMRIIDILSSVPSLLYMILIMMFLKNNIQSILIALCITYWIGTARMTRSQILTLKNQDFALAAKVIGESKMRILLTHLIPNSMGPVIVVVTFLIPSAIFEEAFLSFLGIGIQVPMASWGSLANDAIPSLFTQPYQMLFPALAISITIFALNFIGDGLRDALDPKLRK
jgi:oligopeptide transport system permease protein